ncbi:MAG: aldehyde dehydrogenase family protein [bacterium]|nr:aldehyde dehydrogenase family protein [bacterium]
MNNAIKSAIDKSRKAQKSYEPYTQKQVDILVRAIAKAVYDHGEELAIDAVKETDMGVINDKIIKNTKKPMQTWNYLRDKKTVGIIESNNETGIVKIARPMGIVCAVTPVTNPIITPVMNAMLALKGRNSIIVSPHPKAKNCGKKTVDYMRSALKELNAPEDLIQCVWTETKELNQELMSATDVVVATGGMGIVKAAYSSGKPSYGVGAGNVQVIIDNDVDFDDVAKKIILSKSYDNGILCTSEQCSIIPKEHYDELIVKFKSNGGYYIDDKETSDKIRNVLFVNNMINKDIVGKDVNVIAEKAGITLPKNTKLIIVKSDGSINDPLVREKMCPVMSTLVYNNFSEAISLAQRNLELEGKGHSCAIHSLTEQHVRTAGLELPVSRIVVNEATCLSIGGSPYNGLTPSATIGCGSWGNNSISENLDYKHLINISRIAYQKYDRLVPTVEEMWK